MSVSWPTCDQDGCSGACIGDETTCLAHMGAKERNAALERFSGGGGLDVRGVTISDALLGEIFDAAPRDADGRPALSAALFDGARFEGDAKFFKATFDGGATFFKATFMRGAEFGGVRFEGDAWFGGVRFERGAEFKGATFNGEARFGEATFNGRALFSGATFNGEAWFGKARFAGDANFGSTRFGGDAWFDEARFGGNASFQGTTFQGDGRFNEARFVDPEGGPWFDGAKFEGRAGFNKATFDGRAGFAGVTFSGDAEFDGARFGGDAEFKVATFGGNARFGEVTFAHDAWFGEVVFKGDVPVLGPVHVGGRLDLDGAQFTSLIQIQIKADTTILTCCGGRFPGGVRFDVRRAQVRLDDSDLSVSSLLTGPAVASKDVALPGDLAGLRSFEAQISGMTEYPKLLSLRGANVAGLALGYADLADCRFAGAHDLDKLQLEAGAAFGLSPTPAGTAARSSPRNLRGGRPESGRDAGSARRGLTLTPSRRH